MNDHYSEYARKSVPVKELKFDKVQESDKELLRKIRAGHIKRSKGFLALITVGLCISAWIFFSFLFAPIDNLFYYVIAVVLTGLVMLICAGQLYEILGFIRGIRRGVVLTAQRVAEIKDNRNATYQYVLDIYFEDRDETLMSYSVLPETFTSLLPGDGIILAKVGRKIIVHADPDRKGVMDVSNIKSGV
jgi:hypothetical protein